MVRVVWGVDHRSTLELVQTLELMVMEVNQNRQLPHRQHLNLYQQLKEIHPLQRHNPQPTLHATMAMEEITKGFVVRIDI